jgi:hypothetical protein
MVSIYVRIEHILSCSRVMVSIYVCIEHILSYQLGFILSLMIEVWEVFLYILVNFGFVVDFHGCPSLFA